MIIFFLGSFNQVLAVYEPQKFILEGLVEVELVLVLQKFNVKGVLEAEIAVLSLIGTAVDENGEIFGNNVDFSDIVLVNVDILRVFKPPSVPCLCCLYLIVDRIDESIGKGLLERILLLI